MKNQKTKILLTLSMGLAFQTFGTFAMSKTVSSHPIPSANERPVCAATQKESIALAMPLCGHGCYLEGQEKALHQSLCKNVDVATLKRPKPTIPPSIKKSCVGDQAFTDACLAINHPGESFYGSKSLERPVCAVDAPDSVLLNIPMCGKGCKVESEDKNLPQAMCDGVQRIRFDRPAFVCVGAVQIGPKAYLGISVRVTDARLPDLTQMLAEETAVRGACDGELSDVK